MIASKQRVTSWDSPMEHLTHPIPSDTQGIVNDGG
jgi:hypothetical protein